MAALAQVFAATVSEMKCGGQEETREGGCCMVVRETERDEVVNESVDRKKSSALILGKLQLEK